MNNLKCIYCKRAAITQLSNTMHEKFCKLNPNKQESNLKLRKTLIPWNKGLNKNTDDRVMINALNVKSKMNELYSSGYKNFANIEYWTPEKRKERSEWRKQLHKNDPESHPNRKLAGNRNKISYPEQIAFDYLVQNVSSFEHQKKIGKYYVDFCINQIIIEVDGERWHPIGNLQDKEKDEYLISQGYKVFRIRSKEKIVDKLENILKTEI